MGPKKIVCKFQCQSVEQFAGGTEIVKLTAVTDEVNTWSKWTPAGSFQITINNPDALGSFTPGKKYLIELTETE